MNQPHEPVSRLETALFEFSNQDGEYGAREVTLPTKFPFDETIPPAFEGNMVSVPLAIAKEGKYVKLGYNDKGKVVAHKITITKDDLEQMAMNSTRDVPLNAEHVKYGANYFGWVRTKNPRMHVAPDSDGRHALFAHVEVTQETLDLIEKGRYRDFSPELDLHHKRLQGLALTNYPVMQEIHQFSENTVDAIPEGVNFSEETIMTEEQKAALLSELRTTVEADFSERITSLEAALEAERAARVAAEREAQTQRLAVEFSQKVQKLVKDDEGKSRIHAKDAEAVLNLYAFAATHADTVIDFGEGDEAVSVNPVELLDQVFSNLPAINLLGQVTTESVSEEPVTNFSEDNDLDVDAITKAARTYMGGFEHA